MININKTGTFIQTILSIFLFRIRWSDKIKSSFVDWGRDDGLKKEERLEKTKNQKHPCNRLSRDPENKFP